MEHNGVSIVVNFEGASMEELQLAIASKLNMNTPINIEYLDRDFNRFVTLNQLNELRDKMILRVKPAQITSGPFHSMNIWWIRISFCRSKDTREIRDTIFFFREADVCGRRLVCSDVERPLAFQ